MIVHPPTPNSQHRPLTPAEIDRCLSQLPASAAHLVPIIEAVRTCGLAFVHVKRRARYRGLPELALGRPTLFLIGDDYETSLGPEGFDTKTVRRVLSGARVISVHSGAAETWHYAGPVAAALVTGGKVVIVETQPPHEMAWLNAIQKYAPGAELAIITPEPERYSPHGGRA